MLYICKISNKFDLKPATSVFSYIIYNCNMFIVQATGGKDWSWLHLMPELLFTYISVCFVK